MNHPKLRALFEVIKDGVRWFLSFAVSWFLDNGVVLIINMVTRADLKPSLETQAFLTAVIKYLDYFWHRYNKDTKIGYAGEPSGLFKV